ncbi:MAG: polysaccharide deacetylase family protein [Chitinophagaceae bacterium]|nr:polysaccharide deacetylase family protein [Chitinophagaceae bacterium]
MRYLVKTPWWLKKIYPSYTWDIKTKEKVIYLTFDDGPHEQATPFVLDELKKYNAKASFFCIGKNVAALPDIYKRMLDEGHLMGNHTYSHRNGWKTNDEEYLKDIAEAAKIIDTPLFRPPYGRIRSFQAKNISIALKRKASKIIMWDVLSGDFDETLTREQCLQNVILNTKRGSIVVFHDSQKAFRLLEFVLPRILDFFSSKGYRFDVLPLESD